MARSLKQGRLRKIKIQQTHRRQLETKKKNGSQTQHDAGNIQAATEAAKAAIMAVEEAENPVNSSKPVQGIPRTSGPAQKQPIFDWKVTDKHQEVQNFEIEVKTCS